MPCLFERIEGGEGNALVPKTLGVRFKGNNLIILVTLMKILAFVPFFLIETKG